MELRYVKYRDIMIDAAKNSYRDPDELSDESITPLAEDMIPNGITTPLLVQALATGKYMGRDGNRRLTGIGLNIRRGVAGFTENMLIPVYVLPASVSESEVVKREVASNVQRASLSDTGKVRAAKRMKGLGMTNVEIGPVLGISATSVARLLVLGTNPVWMGYTANHDIPVSTAVNLLQVAEKAERVNDFNKAFDEWRAKTRRTIEAEDNRRRANDEPVLTVAQKWLQAHLKPEQVTAWADQLRSGDPLGPPTFRYRAQIRTGKGPRRLEIEAIKKDLDSLSLEQLGKIAGRIVDLGADLRKALSEKYAAHQQVKADGDPQQKEQERPSQALYREFNLFLDGEPDADAEEAEEATESAEQSVAAQEQLDQGASESSGDDESKAESVGAIAAPPPDVKLTQPTIGVKPPATRPAVSGGSRGKP